MLNTQQKKAVEITEGRVLILAGAGSGKTSVIVHRIAHLIKNLNVPASAILGLTFTNKAAHEMRKRLEELIGKSAAKPIILSTFHSFCMQILRKEIHHLGYTKEFTLYDEKDVKRLFNQLARHMLGQEGELPSLQSTIESISIAKNKALSSETFEGTPFMKELFERLHTCMRAYNAVDFDSLLSLTLDLFEKYPDVLARYQEKYRYIMIDEYQDTNPSQYRLAQLLSSQHNNLCVVGDDDQAIYGWRGAEIKNILHFESTTTIKLEQNYRSTPIILRGANSVISHNKERHVKELWSACEKGDPISLFNAPTEQEEAQGVVQRMIKLHTEYGIPWKEMAILYRSNILASPCELALMQAAWKKGENWVRGIPYQVFGGIEFYERSEIKDIAAYLSAILNPQDQEAILRIINVPRRGISDQTLDILTQINRIKKIPLWRVLKEAEGISGLSDRAKKSIAAFVHLMEMAQEKFKTPPYTSSLKWLLETVVYEKAIEEEVKSEKMKEFKRQNVKAFVSSLEEWEKKDSGPLHDFLATLALDKDSFIPQKNVGSEDKVNLMTFHSAKGLEFTVCFLISLEDHLIPHEKSLSEGNLEEERRLMYVAMTRAKKHLFLSMAHKRKRYGKDTPSNPSRFLFEIPKELLALSNWNDVFD